MTITVEIPDEFAGQLVAAGVEPSRQALEDMAVEAYRAHRLSGKRLRLLLGIGSRYELDGFLKRRGVWLEYTIEDFRREREAPAAVAQNRGNDQR